MLSRDELIKWFADYVDYFKAYCVSDAEDHEMLKAVLSLLKAQEEREKAICKEICYFIRGSCSTDTDADKEYVCHVIQQCFIRFGGRCEDG